MNNWRVIFATALIFGAGVVTGGLLVNYVQHPYLRQFHRAAAKAEARPVATNQLSRVADGAKSRLPEILSKKFLQQLDESLHLAPEQRQAVEKIISESQNQMHKVVQDARLEIREVLTPEQRGNFDELVKRPVHKTSANTNAPAIPPPATNPPAA